MSHSVRSSIVEQQGRSLLLAFRISLFARIAVIHTQALSLPLLSRPSPPRRASGGTCFFSTGVTKFFANDAAQRGLQRLLGPANVLPKSIIDQALIVAAASQVYLLPKPIEKIVIEPNRDSALALGYLHDGSPFCVAEVVFTFHCFPRIAASRAEWPAARRSAEFPLRARCRPPPKVSRVYPSRS